MIFRKLAIAAMMASATAAFAANQASSNQDSSTVKQAQQALNDKGFNVGTADGIVGPKTQAALEKFQQSKGLGGSGTLDSQTLAALGVSGDASASSSTSASSSSSFSPTMDTPSTQSSTTTSPSDNQPGISSSTSQPSTSPSTNQPPSVNQPTPQSYGNK